MIGNMGLNFLNEIYYNPTVFKVLLALLIFIPVAVVARAYKIFSNLCKTYQLSKMEGLTCKTVPENLRRARSNFIRSFILFLLPVVLGLEYYYMLKIKFGGLEGIDLYTYSLVGITLYVLMWVIVAKRAYELDLTCKRYDINSVDVLLTPHKVEIPKDVANNIKRFYISFCLALFVTAFLLVV